MVLRICGAVTRSLLRRSYDGRGRPNVACFSLTSPVSARTRKPRPTIAANIKESEDSESKERGENDVSPSSDVAANEEVTTSEDTPSGDSQVTSPPENLSTSYRYIQENSIYVKSTRAILQPLKEYEQVDQQRQLGLLSAYKDRMKRLVKSRQDMIGIFDSEQTQENKAKSDERKTAIDDQLKTFIKSVRVLEQYFEDLKTEAPPRWNPRAVLRAPTKSASEYRNLEKGMLDKHRKRKRNVGLFASSMERAVARYVHHGRSLTRDSQLARESSGKRQSRLHADLEDSIQLLYQQDVKRDAPKLSAEQIAWILGHDLAGMSPNTQKRLEELSAESGTTPSPSPVADAAWKSPAPRQVDDEQPEHAEPANTPRHTSGTLDRSSQKLEEFKDSPW